METVSLCPNCGKSPAPNAPQGLCPECLLKGAFPTGTADVSGDAPEGKQPRFVPPAIEDLARHFPQLEILKFIGQGGMGAVYQARQKELDRIVALKILPPQVAGGAGFAERFTQEARALGKLNHPHIVTLYQFGQADGLFYFLMEFVDGVTLQQLLQNGRILPREALAIVPQICDALQYAHQRGIVHRDIKPGNILLSKEGWVKIADFGVAKIVAGGLDETGGSASARASELTGAAVLGTPQYMAPEQVASPQEVDHRADIYSLGVVFYEMLTGELPAGKLAPPSSRLRGLQIDVRLDEVVLRALEKQPSLRFQEAGTMKTVVETIATTPPVPPAASRPEAPAGITPPPQSAGPLPSGSFAGKGLNKTIKWVAIAVLATALLTTIAVFGAMRVWRAIARHRETAMADEAFQAQVGEPSVPEMPQPATAPTEPAPISDPMDPASPERIQDLASRLQAAESIISSPPRDEALAVVAKDAALVGKTEMVKKALAGISNSPRRDQAAAAAAKILVKHASRKDAIEVASKITNSSTRDQIMSELAR